MTLIDWAIIFIIVQVIHGLGTWKLYVKANKRAIDAFIPIYNAIVLLKIINRPWWWVFLLFIPVINVIMIPVIWVQTAWSFGRFTEKDTVLQLLTLGFYTYYLNYLDKDIRYIENRDTKPKTKFGEWVNSILFAIVAATLVHTYVMQPFTIPTSSLEKSLLVGDFLFVSKFHYGARVPNTVIAAPMVHDTLPGIKLKSYIPKIELPYMRIPGFQKIKNNDIVVFNWPVDTVYHMYKAADKNYYKPIDKKTNYVKRCTAIAGDTLEIKNGFVYVNGKKNILPDRAKIQFSYFIELKKKFTSENDVTNFMESLKKYGVKDGISRDQKTGDLFVIAATTEEANNLKNHPLISKIWVRKEENGYRDSGIFPRNKDFNWNNDFMGPLYIPKEGVTVNLNKKSLPLYKRLISVYENHELKVNGNKIFVDGKETNTYTFEQNYYWMMGDNRHNSLDSRAWGFVPYDHVVGKPVFIWMSLDFNAKGFDKLRLERFFTTVGGSGKPKSYLMYFLIALAGYYGFKEIKKRKNKEE